MVVDESFGVTRQGCYELTRTHHHAEHTLRISVRRDSYAHQSSAWVDVLTPALAWTTLASAHPSTWHIDTPLVPTDAAPLRPLADALLSRALTILSH